MQILKNRARKHLKIAIFVQCAIALKIAVLRKESQLQRSVVDYDLHRHTEKLAWGSSKLEAK